MPLRPVTFREVVRKLKAAGFIQVSQKGNHLKFLKRTSAGTLTTIILRHRDIAVGTLRSILRQANISADAFDKL